LKWPLSTPRRGQIACLVLGLILASPALAVPFALDDYFHLANLEGLSAAKLRWWELFTFAPADAARRSALIAEGTMPWWSAADLRLAFFRPLSSALVVMDHAVFGRWAPGWHLHALLWWGALLVCVGRCYRRVLPAGLALFSLLLFAIDDAHWMPIAWLAARNGQVAMVPALLGLMAHLRWREEGWRAGAVLAPLGLAVGLLGGEVAFGVLAYVLAFEVVGRTRTPGDGPGRGLLPYAPVLVVYAVVRKAAGAGVSGSGSYLDPTHDPVGFAGSAPGRVTALIADAVFNVPGELWGAGTLARGILVAAGLLALALVVLWLRRALAVLPPAEARAVRWLALGALLALVPGAASMMGERILLPASLGAAAVFAVLVRDGARRWRAARGQGFLRRAALGLLIAAVALPNLVLAPPMLMAKILFWRKMADRTHAGVCRLPLDRPTGIVVLWSDDPSVLLFAGAVRRLQCPEAMTSWTVLSISPHPQQLERTSPATLALTTRDQPLLDSAWELGVRAPGRPLRAGDSVVQAGGLRLTVAAVRDGRPTELRIEAPGPLEQGPFGFFVWRKGGLSPFPLPPQGASVTLTGR